MSFFNRTKGSENPAHAIDIAIVLIRKYRIPIDERFKKIMLEVTDEDECRDKLFKLAREYRVNTKAIFKGGKG